MGGPLFLQEDRDGDIPLSSAPLQGARLEWRWTLGPVSRENNFG